MTKLLHGTTVGTAPKSRKPIKIGILAILILLIAPSASPVTNSSATISWNKTTDNTIRYEIRWKNWTLTDWQSVARDLDSTLGVYQHTFAPLPDSTGDRYACWDLRAYWIHNGIRYNSDWISLNGKQVCNQIPLSVSPTPTPVPLPDPVPPPSGLAVLSATPLEVVISGRGCLKVTTSTKGSTLTVQKRTVTCVK